MKELYWPMCTEQAGLSVSAAGDLAEAEAEAGKRGNNFDEKKEKF